MFHVEHLILFDLLFALWYNDSKQRGELFAMFFEKIGGVAMEALHFDRVCSCDWCGQKEICAVCHIGTSHYNRLVCVECALSINENNRRYSGNLVDLNNSTIDFSCLKEKDNEDKNEDLEG